MNFGRHIVCPILSLTHLQERTRRAQTANTIIFIYFRFLAFLVPIFLSCSRGHKSCAIGAQPCFFRFKTAQPKLLYRCLHPLTSSLVGLSSSGGVVHRRVYSSAETLPADACRVRLSQDVNFQSPLAESKARSWLTTITETISQALTRHTSLFSCVHQF